MSTRTLIRLFLLLFLTAITGSLSAALPTRDLAGKKGPLLSRTDNPDTLLASFTYVLDKGGATAILKALDRAIAAEKDAASLATLKKARAAFVANPAEAIRQVAVAGSWNGWNAGQFVLGEEKLGGFVAYARQCDLSFTAPKELYGYLFMLAAGEDTVTVRVTDPLAPQTIEDGIGGTLGLVANRWFRGGRQGTSAMVADVKALLAKATRDIEDLTKELDAVNTAEDAAKLQERSQKLMMDMGTAMAELQKKHGASAQPSEADQKAVMEDIAKMTAAAEAFARKAAEVSARLTGNQDNPDEPAEEPDGEDE